MKLIDYIERNHERFGVALFVIPPCVAVLGLISLVELVVGLLR